jgi:hypothetical protein
MIHILFVCGQVFFLMEQKTVCLHWFGILCGQKKSNIRINQQNSIQQMSWFQNCLYGEIGWPQQKTAIKQNIVTYKLKRIISFFLYHWTFCLVINIFWRQFVSYFINSISARMHIQTHLSMHSPRFFCHINLFTFDFLLSIYDSNGSIDFVHGKSKKFYWILNEL